ncbi:MAG: hypothetical protein WB511_14150, partial [Nitrososphaeraceae archaeon]
VVYCPASAIQIFKPVIFRISLTYNSECYIRLWIFCEYCELANKINPDKSSKVAKSIHEKCRVIMELNGKQ